MKKNILSLSASVLLSLSVAVLGLSSCSDKIYQEINTDPAKAETMNPTLQLTYAELEIFGDMNYVDVHRLYVYAFTQQLMGCWNTTYYGGQQRVDDNEMSRPWNNLYAGAIRNLTDGLAHCNGNADMANIEAALRIFRVYVISLLTDYYGDVPDSEAGLAYLTGNSKPRYDTQEEIYHRFFTELKTAVEMFDPQAKSIDSDPLFRGDVGSWKRFANSLRMRFAMRLKNRLPELAQQEFVEALQAGALDKGENACVQHLNVSYSFGQESYKDFRGNALAKYFYGNDPANNPTYICQTFWDQLYNNNDPRTTRLCRFYIDDFMSLSEATGRIDMTDAVMATQAKYPSSKIIHKIGPGKFSWTDWPSYNAYSPLKERVAEVLTEHPTYNPKKNPRWLMPKLANNFLRSDNPGVIMTYAEVCFLKAEATLEGWIAEPAAALYYEGIEEAMKLLSDYYGCEVITQEEYETYVSQDAILFAEGDKNKCLEQINTQAWILHFHNPAECWANVRRSNYPALQEPTYKEVIDRGGIPVRLCYPLKEETYNIEEYEAARNRAEADYNWHAHVWWDVDPQ